MRIPRAAFAPLLLCAAVLFTADDASAQRRGARGIRHVPGRVVVMRAYYAPLFYDPWFNPYGSGYGWYPPYAYGQAYEPGASLRVQAEPRETEVFVDGYYAGSVDDFDGFFQRLHLESGEHEVTLYLAGHRTARQSVYLQPGRMFRIRHTMEALPAGSLPEPRPASPPAGARGPTGVAPPPRDPGPPPATAASGDAGTIAIRVQPAGADVFIDGEQWEGPDANEQLVVQMAPGAHRIEIRRDGYRSYSADVDVRAGDVSPLNVSLSRQ